jgi:hypothetical protein
MWEPIIAVVVIVLALMALAPAIHKAPPWIRFLAVLPGAAYFLVSGVTAETNGERLWSLLLSALFIAAGLLDMWFAKR